jgi:hypothetical protein
MIRIILFLISVSFLAFILEPFFAYLLALRGEVAYAIAATGMVSPIGLTAVFSMLSAVFVLSIYRFFH